MDTKLDTLLNCEQVHLMRSLYDLSNKAKAMRDKFEPILDNLFRATFEPVNSKNLREFYFRLLDYDSEYDRAVEMDRDNFDYLPKPYDLIRAARNLFN